ncbi:unnamed protein product [Camellia sinensis]
MGWIRYILPSIFVILVVLMLWYGHIKKERPVEAFKITIPLNENAAEQLLTLQEAITQVESLIQDGNITLLKVRALLFAALPQFLEMPLRKANRDRWLRRVREWWVRIPAAPVLLIKADDKKRK